MSKAKRTQDQEQIQGGATEAMDPYRVSKDRGTRVSLASAPVMELYSSKRRLIYFLCYLPVTI